MIPLQLGLLFIAFPFALAALLRDRVKAVVLWIVLLAVALAPTLQIQTASAVADVPLAVFFALAGAAGWRWVEVGESPMLWVTGVFAAAGVGTKVEGGLFAALLFLALGVAGARRGRPLRRLALVATAVALSAFRGSSGRVPTRSSDPVSTAGGLSPAASVRVPSAAGSMLRELADPSSWLVLVALAAVAVVLALRRPSGREAALFTCFVTLSCLAGLVAVYWATPLDFDYHVATSVRRVITAPVLFAVAMTPLLLAPCAESERSVDGERALDHPFDRELGQRPLPSRGAEAACTVGIGEERGQLPRHARDVAGVHERTGLAVDDDLGHGADARRDDGQRGQHRLQQHDPEALPARRVDEDVGAGEPVADLRPAGQRERVTQAELGGKRACRILERARAEDREPRIRHLAADERERAQQRRVVLLLDQPADCERERASRRDPGLLGRRLGRRACGLVEPVVDRHELPRVVSRRLEEDPHGVRDRDQPAGAVCERPVDVAERAEEVAVVVVPRREVGSSRRPVAASAP